MIRAEAMPPQDGQQRQTLKMYLDITMRISDALTFYDFFYDLLEYELLSPIFMSMKSILKVKTFYT